MKCVICKQGETALGKATVTLQRGDSTIIFKDVPAEVCENCGEYYLSEVVTEQLLNRAEVAVKSGAEVEILRFAA
ncbi:MAG: type II toxin-antitoxin system MqsA family antitoxin [Desulfobaccales bacterium]